MAQLVEMKEVDKDTSQDLVQVEYQLDEYIEHFSHLVELERREEMERHEREMRKLSGWERQKKGRAVLNIKARDEGKGLGGKYLIKFVRRDGLPEIEINVGDLVRVSKNQPLSDDNPSGTVTEKTGYSLIVAFDEKPPSWVYDKVRIDLYVNDITYQRMLDTLDNLKNLEGSKRKLINKLLERKELEFSDSVPVYFNNQYLNESQKKAVDNALKANNLYLIHGPPGTGKTVTCIEIIEQAIEKEKNVLACADSNTAVDNLVEFLVSKGREVVRVGHPARVTPLLREHTLDYIVEDNDAFQKAQELREKAYDLKEKQENYTYPSGRWRRGLSNEAIKSLAKKGKGSRGIPPNKMKEMAKSLEIQEEIDELFKKVNYLEDKAVDEVLDKADVICTTNSSSASEVMSSRDFDLCVIDEATQATEPSCLVPAVKAKKLVIAGDHKQLPPTILNEEAKDKGLSDTLFERMVGLYGDRIKTLLRVQYRMNEKIMRFPDDEFYEGKVKADQSVREHVLRDIIEKGPEGKFVEVLDPDKPIVFIDTRGQFKESTKEGSTSKENEGEAVIASHIAKELVDMGVKGKDIGVITPYDDQKALIKKKLDIKNIEIDTVDGFQGREKEVIILSFTRSNDEGNIGFLKDLRRLNVSITRAKRKLIIIGDSKTISGNDIYNRLINYVQDEGDIVTVNT